MPFVRFARDRRGYEHVYLIDQSKERGRSRVLYWYRTPPGVKVGRSAFDLETQRSLEQQNPDVHFDWPQIVAARIPPPAPVESWREKRRAERAFKRARAAEEGVAAETTETERIAEFGLQDELDVPALDPGGPEGPHDGDDEGQGSVGIAPDEFGDAAVHEAAQGAEDAPDNAPAQPPGPLAAEASRRARRRRRRGRRSSNRPAGASSGSDRNGPLDPVGLPERPSNED